MDTQPTPQAGDQAVLTDTRGRQDGGWIVIHVLRDGARVSVSKCGFIKHLDRIPDGRFEHTPGIYATFTTAAGTHTQEG